MFIDLLFQITVPDFTLYEILDQHRLQFPACLDDFPKLREYTARFEVKLGKVEKKSFHLLHVCH